MNKHLYRARRNLQTICKQLATLIVIALLAIAPANQAQNKERTTFPNLGDAAANGIPFSEEKWLGEIIMYELRSSLPLISDIELNEYLQTLGARLLAASPHSDLNFHFLLANDEAINAFATFGGNIVTFSGLLLATDEENELAGVMAHEIAHASRRHAARLLTLSKDVQLESYLPLAAALVAAVVGGNAKLASLGLYTGISTAVEKQLQYSRVFENEADRFGMERMAMAGFAPQGMPVFFKKLWRMENFNSALPEYLRSHPLTSERLAQSLERAVKYKTASSTSGGSYLFAKARLSGLLKPLKFQKEALTNDAVKQYRRGVALMGSNKAAEALRVLTKINSPAAEIQLEIARAHLALNNPEKAAFVLTTLVKLYPDRASISFLLAETEIMQNKAAAALQTLAQIAHLSARYPKINALRAKAAASADKGWLSHEYLGDYYWQNGRFQAANEQFQLAKKSALANRTSRLRTQAKITALQALRNKIKSKK